MEAPEHTIDEGVDEFLIEEALQRLGRGGSIFTINEVLEQLGISEEDLEAAPDVVFE